MKSKIMIHETILNNKKFRIIINTEYNTASANFVTDESTTSLEIDDYVILHYGNRTKTLIGFTILHLKEFIEYMQKQIKKYIQERKLKEQEWLKQKAEQSIYEVINKKIYRRVFQIPQPLWHMSYKFK